MNSDKKLQELLDKQEISERIIQLSRGLDRHDAELARGAYHEDGRDDHGMFIGSGYEMIEWGTALHDSMTRGHQHYITNIYIELDGDQAHAESYVTVVLGHKDSMEHSMSGGRFVDRFERRNGRWAIADRIVIFEWSSNTEVIEMAAAFGHPHTQDKADVSYVRPLRVTRERPDTSALTLRNGLGDTPASGD